MGTVLVGVAAFVIGAVLAVATVFTMIGAVGGPSAEEVAQQRADEAVSAEDLAYGNN